MSKRYEIKFYVGVEQDKDGNPIKNLSLRMISARETLIFHFQAFSQYDHVGTWGEPAVSENGITFVVVTTAEYLRYVNFVTIRLRDIFNQSCVLVTRSEVEAEFI